MKLDQAYSIANKYIGFLEPFCKRIQIAGSIRREKEEVGDIEIVCIPDDIPGFSEMVNRWKKVKGEPTGRYTQRNLPEGIKLDLFMAKEGNWGNILAIRTGSAEYSFKVLACSWVNKGYKSENGFLKDKDNNIIELKEEIDLFNLIGLDYAEPRNRNL